MSKVPEYSGNKKLKDILAACKKKGWPVNTEKYDNHGSDWVLIGFVHDGQRFEVSLSSFNGCFIVKDGEKYVTESSTEYDDVPWYRALLDFLYVRSSEKSRRKA